MARTAYTISLTGALQGQWFEQDTHSLKESNPNWEPSGKFDNRPWPAAQHISTQPHTCKWACGPVGLSSQHQGSHHTVYLTGALQHTVLY